jgi:hypothetical protein
VRARAAHDCVASQSGSGAVCVRRGRLLLLLERSVQEQRRELVERQPHAGRAAYKRVDTAEVKQKRDGQDRTHVGVCWPASYLFGRRVSAEAGLCRACSAWVSMRRTRM